MRRMVHLIREKHRFKMDQKWPSVRIFFQISPIVCEFLKNYLKDRNEISLTCSAGNNAFNGTKFTRFFNFFQISPKFCEEMACKLRQYYSETMPTTKLAQRGTFRLLTGAAIFVDMKIIKVDCIIYSQKFVSKNFLKSFLSLFLKPSRHQLKTKN